MERSALYRRALAPIMLTCGVIGVGAATATCFVRIEEAAGFSALWLVTALVALAAALLLVRRQALKEAELFWSPPTRRVGQALLPAFVAGLAAGIIFLLDDSPTPASTWYLAVFWTAIYGCALNGAGFFMQRGIRLFGWAFIIGGSAAFAMGFARPALVSTESAHYLMGLFFGLLHLAYGVYLYFTERSRKTA